MKGSGGREGKRRKGEETKERERREGRGEGREREIVSQWFLKVGAWAEFKFRARRGGVRKGVEGGKGNGEKGRKRRNGKEGGKGREGKGRLPPTVISKSRHLCGRQLKFSNVACVLTKTSLSA